MYWIARLLAVVALLAVLLYGVGLLIPSERSISKTTIIDAPPQRVFQTMTDVEGQPKWRSDVRSVQDLVPGELRQWNETRNGGGVVHVEERVKEAGKKYEVAFRDSGGLEGRWVAELEPSNENRTKLTCTETRITDRPLLRLPAMLLSFGGTDWDVYLGDLNRAAAGDEENPKEAWSPTPTVKPTATPSATPAATPSATPSASPAATPKSTAAATPI
jgi:uncharacterized protein YndB with AHSA1/START domain